MGIRERFINLAVISPSRWQPRRVFDANDLLELAHSINGQGLLNDILVFECGSDVEDLRFELIAGERRTRAALALTLHELFPLHDLADWCARLAQVGLVGLGDEERAAVRASASPLARIAAKVYPNEDIKSLHLIAVTENLDRADLTALEEGNAFVQLIEAYGWSQRELAGQLNKSQGYVAQRLLLVTALPEVQEALNTRVIGVTEARALASAPAVIQQAATTWAVAGVQSATPLSTRQIEKRVNEARTFIDPARWLPNGETVYSAQERNRLAVIRYWLTQPLSDVAAQVISLGDYNQFGRTINLLGKSPREIVQITNYYLEVVAAIAVADPINAQTEDHAAAQHWDHYAARVGGLTCASCIFGSVDMTLNETDLVHCPRWKRRRVTTCEGHIAPGAPVGIMVRWYEVMQTLSQQGKFIGTCTTDADAYLAAVRAELLRRTQQKQHEGKRNEMQHLPAMRAFAAWQQDLPAEARAHAQAHTCERCMYYAPLLGAQDLPPCRFAINPLRHTAGERGVRAPRYVEWQREDDGLTVPRCEGFAYQTAPFFGPFSGATNLGTALQVQARVATWMSEMFHGAFSNGNAYLYERMGLWGVLSWLPYRHEPTKISIGDLWTYVEQQWRDWSDATLAHLLDIGCSEARTLRCGMPSDVIVLNPLTGVSETWQATPFRAEDACTRCKASHPLCTECCARCKTPCNAQQACHL